MNLTLSQHIRHAGGDDAGDLAILLGQLALAGKMIAWELERAALLGQLGPTGETNVQGEAVWPSVPMPSRIRSKAGGRPSGEPPKTRPISAS